MPPLRPRLNHLPSPIRTLHTTPHPRAQTIRSNLPSTTPRAGPVPHANPTPYPQLLRRDPTRPLPTLSSLNPNRRWLRTAPIFLAILAASAAGIFNYQKVNSPIITATLYSLRTNPTARSELGDNVYFASQWAWVWGSINLVQGNVDVRFRVKGTRGAGTCRFKARRIGGRAEAFTTSEWSLTMDGDGRVLQLLDSAADPLAGQAM